MMGRQPRRSSVKALQAIKATNHTRNKVTKKSEIEGSKPMSRRRSALGDVTNQSLRGQVPRSKVTGKAPFTQASAALQSFPSQPENSTVIMKENLVGPPQLSVPTTRKAVESNTMDVLPPSHSQEDTPITTVQNSLQATTLCDFSLESVDSPEKRGCEAMPTSPTVEWKDIDAAEAHDPLFSSEYAPDIYSYMKERELHFMVPAYMSSQPDISASMRTILVDWLIEVQENFELFHETLYLAVQLTDRYLANRDVKREYLQLVGATSMLIAAKFEELSPPLVDDFLYLCDDAYTHEDLLKMERNILQVLDYDINIPVAYRFLRRLARAAEATMETHTLARYICESTLQDYSFVTERPSYIAASSMYLALRMKRLGPWTPTLQHYSGYSVADMLPMVKRLNALLKAPLGQTATVRSKYSHEVFFKVATLPALEDVEEDSVLALVPPNH